MHDARRPHWPWDLFNVVAVSTTLDVTVRAEELQLLVEDDGVGISNRASTTRGRGFALPDMRFQADQVRGTLDVERPDTGGTTITFAWLAS